MVVLLAVLPVGQVVQSDEQRRPEDEDEGDAVEEAGGVLRVGRRPEVGPEAELLEGDARQVEPPGAADLVLAVDVVDVLVGILVDPLAGDVDELPLLPEEGGALGARLGARRLLAVLHPVEAELALLHVRKGAVVLVLRDVERAGDHAVPASHAPVLVVDDRPVLRLLERLDEARGGAGGLVAVETLLPGEDRLVRLLLVREPVDDRVRLRGRLSLLLEHALAGEGDLGLREAVLLVARLLARPAPDALRRVDQHAVELAPVADRRGGVRLAGLAPGETRPRGPGDLQEIPSVETHRDPPIGRISSPRSAGARRPPFRGRRPRP